MVNIVDMNLRALQQIPAVGVVGRGSGEHDEGKMFQLLYVDPWIAKALFFNCGAAKRMMFLEREDILAVCQPVILYFFIFKIGDGEQHIDAMASKLRNQLIHPQLPGADADPRQPFLELRKQLPIQKLCEAGLNADTENTMPEIGEALHLDIQLLLKPAEAFAGFTNTNVVMFVAMFVIGAAITKTSLLDRAQQLVVKYKDRPKMLILIASLVAAFLACLTSATATAAIMIPLLVGVCNEIGVSRSKLLYPAMAVANIATAMTFLGQGASNMAWSDVMMKAGAAVPLNIWDFTIARIPILLITFLYMVFFGYRLMPDRDNAGFQDKIQAKDVSAKLSAGKERLAVLIVLATIVLMLLEKTIGIRMYLTASLGAVLLVLTGILSEKEALASIHQPTVFLFAGVLALSDAIAATGAGDVVAEWMLRLLGNTTNPYFIMAVFFIIPLILTQVMSNLATVTIFIPLVATACVKLGVDPRAAVIGVLTASCTSIMTPMAAPCQIMIMGPGGYSLKDYLKCGTPLVILITAASILIFPIMFPFFG